MLEGLVDTVCPSTVWGIVRIQINLYTKFKRLGTSAWISACHFELRELSLVATDTIWTYCAVCKRYDKLWSATYNRSTYRCCKRNCFVYQNVDLSSLCWFPFGFSFNKFYAADVRLQNSKVSRTDQCLSSNICNINWLLNLCRLFVNCECLIIYKTATNNYAATVFWFNSADAISVHLTALIVLRFNVSFQSWLIKKRNSLTLYNLKLRPLPPDGGRKPEKHVPHDWSGNRQECCSDVWTYFRG